MIETEGFKDVLLRFSSLPTDIGVGIRKAINQSVLMVQADAKRSIERPSGGRVYKRGKSTKGRGKRARIGARTEIHIASKPGDAPNKDNGDLIKYLKVSKVKGNTRKGYSAYVKSLAPYSMDLEYGTNRMAARPFLRPALAKNAPKIEKLIFNAVRSQL